ncbi:hypothetical protein [Rickettsiella endosymbiont of Dermanyssus gallinae]|uniref:hypothetical protein n=1 Tax=Rickettsiella endosymbiont of Dermanyssus gallinae TaxID=2856608 RepID=UPI001C531DE5|nr:hypothetical protein [Rickettsiella endosymbiont of Dermanyssus gallinae]
MTTGKLLASIIFNLTIATLLALSVFVPGCAFLFPAVAGAIIGLHLTIPTLAIIYLAISAAFILKDTMNVIFNLTCANTQYQSTNSDISPNDTYFNNMNYRFSRTNDRPFVSPSGPFFKSSDRSNSVNSHATNN